LGKELKKEIMESTRLNKVNRLLQKELGDYFLKDSREYYEGALITVTVVRVTPDLGLAKVYLSLFPPQLKEKVFETIRDRTKSIRHELGQRIRHQIRVIPELVFYQDDSLDYIEKIDNLLRP
jgi:ribosome-binding factor A